MSFTGANKLINTQWAWTRHTRQWGPGLESNKMKSKLLEFILVVTLAQEAALSPISSTCRQKVGQVLCSIHHSDQLRLCFNGVTDGAIFLNPNIESYCFTHEPELCVTDKLCTLAINDETTSAAPPRLHQEPKVSFFIVESKTPKFFSEWLRLMMIFFLILIPKKCRFNEQDFKRFWSRKKFVSMNKTFSVLWSRKKFVSMNKTFSVFWSRKRSVQ